MLHNVNALQKEVIGNRQWRQDAHDIEPCSTDKQDEPPLFCFRYNCAGEGRIRFASFTALHKLEANPGPETSYIAYRFHALPIGELS